jgi:methylenetetrahydrofolate reductase (NADPH)
MKISHILKQREQGVAFEFFPPRSERSEAVLAATLRELKAYDPLYVSMTCGAAGTSHEVTRRAVGLLSGCENLVVMPHITCVSTSPGAIEETLDYYKSLGVENVMALRGDIPPEADSETIDNDLAHAQDLIDLIKRYGGFDIGAAVYPEGHVESTSLERDLYYTKEKIAAGVDFGVTQMFFDNSYFYNFLERLKNLGVTTPILPGILPMTNIVKVKEFAAMCRCTVPSNIEDTLDRFAGNPKDMEKAGIELTIKQCKDLLAHGFRKLHFFTLNRASVMKKIIDEVF